LPRPAIAGVTTTAVWTAWVVVVDVVVVFCAIGEPTEASGLGLAT
jgi:hypothetical protein